jgi:hypothetical protein
MRSLVFSLLLLVVSSSPLSAQTWVKSLFPETFHDFGTVAKAAKTEYRFPVENKLDQDIHIASVRASCGCTTPIIENETIKPGQTGYVMARFNTGTFTGARGATLTVVIDKPRYAEIQLQVKGYIRSDVVFNPGEINFGTVDAGEEKTATVDLDYVGRSDWQITNVRSPNDYVTAAVKEVNRSGGRIGYELSVSIREGAPIGLLQNELILETNDRRLKTVAVRYNADVRPLLSISPQRIDLKEVVPGSKIQERIVIRSSKPFKVTAIQCDGFLLDYEPVTEEKSVHLIPVTLTATEELKGESAKLRIRTDLPGELSAELETTYLVAENAK